MMELDELLSIVENPTRRRILEYLTREPSYPLQLSKELGISQQAVMKNLSLMEQNGMVMSYPEASSMGPTRTVYAPNTQFTIVIDMHDNMFSARIVSSGNIQSDEAHIEGMEEAMERIKRIDSRIQELDDERSDLLSERNAVMSWFNQTIHSIEDPEKRKELYGKLDNLTEDDKRTLTKEV